MEEAGGSLQTELLEARAQYNQGWAEFQNAGSIEELMQSYQKLLEGQIVLEHLQEQISQYHLLLKQIPECATGSIFQSIGGFFVEIGQTVTHPIQTLFPSVEDNTQHEKERWKAQEETLSQMCASYRENFTRLKKDASVPSSMTGSFLEQTRNIGITGKKLREMLLTATQGNPSELSRDEFLQRKLRLEVLFEWERNSSEESSEVRRTLKEAACRATDYLAQRDEGLERTEEILECQKPLTAKKRKRLSLAKREIEWEKELE